MKKNDILNYSPENQVGKNEKPRFGRRKKPANVEANQPVANEVKGNEQAPKTKQKKTAKGTKQQKAPQNVQQNADKNTAKNKKQKANNPLTHHNVKSKLKVMFLGGVGEIGKNMTVFEYGNSMVIIDTGISFPTETMPGVDVVIPDMSYVLANKHKLKALLLTHGHEDHIGAVPYLVKLLGIKIDIFATKLTLGLLETKLLEHGIIDKVNMVEISDRSIVSIADFSAEFIHVSHSVAGSVAIVLRTPVGTVLHTGDFKIDYTPLGNEIMNLNRIAEVGKEGVLLLMSESTNSEKPGYTMTEAVVANTLRDLFAGAKGRRIIIATFASNIDRLALIINLAKQFNRKIAVSGRSMVKCIDVADRVGYINIDKSMFVDINRIDDVAPEKLVILSTGSQGEPMAALTRMASDEFNKIKVGTNDTIILSSSPIPGNEKDVFNVINKLSRRGAEVIYSSLAAIHVSGHACQEELKLIYTLVKPKYFIPVHGEYRHLKQHSRLVESLGHNKKAILMPDIGDCIEISGNSFVKGNNIISGSVMVDGLGIGDVGDSVLKDRLMLAEDGIVVVTVAINKSQGKIVAGPQVISRGCFYFGSDDTAQTLEDIKHSLTKEIYALQLQTCALSAVKSAVNRSIKQYFRVNLKRNPVVLPVILEVE